MLWCCCCCFSICFYRLIVHSYHRRSKLIKQLKRLNKYLRKIRRNKRQKQTYYFSMLSFRQPPVFYATFLLWVRPSPFVCFFGYQEKLSVFGSFFHICCYVFISWPHLSSWVSADTPLHNCSLISCTEHALK